MDGFQSDRGSRVIRTWLRVRMRLITRFLDWVTRLMVVIDPLSYCLLCAAQPSVVMARVKERNQKNGLLTVL